MPRQELMNDAYAVQTTAYALMSHINANRLLKVERDMTMSWLNTMRNSFGGFASTQVNGKVVYSCINKFITTI